MFWGAFIIGLCSYLAMRIRQLIWQANMEAQYEQQYGWPY